MSDAHPHPDGRVLAAIDTSIYAHSVAAHAAWAAQRMAAPLELLHVLERNTTTVPTDLSGNLSLGNQEALLAELALLDEQRAKLSQAHGRALLDHVLARLAQQHDMDAEVLQRHGTLVDTLLELEGNVRLFVLGKRGGHADREHADREHADTEHADSGYAGSAMGRIGSTLEHAVRAVHRPVLVASRAFKPIERFMIAFDGSATTRKCVEMVCNSPLLHGKACGLLLVGDTNDNNQQHLEWALEQLRHAGFVPQAQILSGHADAVIARQVVEQGIDLLVMGAYGHSRIRSMLVGSTTTQVLRDCAIPVLLLR